MHRLARLVVRLRFVVVVFWVAATVGAVTQLPSIEEAGAGAVGSIVPSEAEALRAERLSKTLFAFPLLSRNVVVVSAGEGLPPGALRALAQAAEGVTAGSSTPPTSSPRPPSPVSCWRPRARRRR